MDAACRGRGELVAGRLAVGQSARIERGGVESDGPVLYSTVLATLYGYVL